MPFDGNFVGMRPPPRGWRTRLAAWRENLAARRDLGAWLQTDARFARDIGLTREQIAVERDRPLWIFVRDPRRWP